MEKEGKTVFQQVIDSYDGEKMRQMHHKRVIDKVKQDFKDGDFLHLKNKFYWKMVFYVSLHFTDYQVEATLKEELVAEFGFPKDIECYVASPLSIHISRYSPKEETE